MALRNLLSRDRHPERADPDVILVGPEAERKRRSGARWGLALVIYMRLLALVWMTYGVLLWAQILNPGPRSLDALPFGQAVALCVFAVADLVAAVGLWLIAPWGGALWLATAVGEIVTGMIIGAPTGDSVVWLSGYVAMIVLYFVLTGMAARERERP